MHDVRTLQQRKAEPDLFCNPRRDLHSISWKKSGKGMAERSAMATKHINYWLDYLGLGERTTVKRTVSGSVEGASMGPCSGYNS